MDGRFYNLQQPEFLFAFRSLLWPLVSRNKWIGLWISFLGIVHILSLLWIPIIVQTLFQKATHVRQMSDLVFVGEKLILSAVLVSASSVLLEHSSSNSLHRDLHEIEVRLFKKLLSMRVSETERMSVGYLQSRIKDDIPSISPLILGDMAPYLVIGLQLGAVIVLLWRIDWMIALVSIAIAAGISAANIAFTPRLRKLAQNIHETSAKLNGYLAEVITFLPLIKTCVAEEAEKRTFIRDSEALNKQKCQFLTFSKYLGEANSGLGRIGFLAIALVGAWRIESGALTAAIFMSSVIYINILLYSSRSLINFTPRLATAVECACRLSQILTLEPEDTRSPGPAADSVQGIIEFRNVSFTYPSSSRPALRNVDLFIPAGSKVAVIGPSGAGKSTLMKLILGFEKPTSGKVLIPGCALEELDLRTVRRNTGYVSQGSMAVLRRTVRENIILGRPNATHEELCEASRAAKADLFIASLPRGYDSVIGYDQDALSGGQGQRIALAREFLRQPRILLMDEATSQLDVNTERAIIETLVTVFRETTCIVISHRVPTVAEFDLIIMVEEGEIAASGTHQELMEQHLPYQKLLSSQEDKNIKDAQSVAQVTT
jgi:ABC-type bacteriocin/lantibiotic exporter with double-glycine peptidase domain